MSVKNRYYFKSAVFLKNITLFNDAIYGGKCTILMLIVRWKKGSLSDSVDGTKN